MKWLLFFGAALSGLAQEAVPAAPLKLEFTNGSPIRIPFTCSEEALQEAGATCTETEPCDVFLELASIEAVADKLFLGGNLHSGSSTFSSILLASEDSGKTWTESHLRILHGVLDEIYFIDFAHGWIAGQILSQFPRDPFFLITQDGGKTWKKRDLFNEGRPGLIEAFFFDSKSDGMLTLDRSRGAETKARYEQYETRTGGDTWMLREVSPQPIALKRKKAVSNELRLRADAASGAYAIEQLRSGKWELLSSFLIQLPTCKIEMQELTPPDEPEHPAIHAPLQPELPKRPPSLKKK